MSDRDKTRYTRVYYLQQFDISASILSQDLPCLMMRASTLTNFDHIVFCFTLYRLLLFLTTMGQ